MTVPAANRAHFAKQDAAQITQALNILLSEFGLTDHARVTALALFGVSGGRNEFASYYSIIAKQLAKEEEFLSSNPEKHLEHYQKVRRRLQQLKEEQDKLGITLMEWTPGGTTPDGTKYASKFKLPLAQMATTAYETAHKNPEFHKNPGKAIDSAAHQLAHQMLSKATPTDVPKPPNDLNQAIQQRFFRIGKTVERQLSATISMAVEAGWSYDQIQDEVNLVFNNLDNIHLRTNTSLQTLMNATQPSTENEQDVTLGSQGGAIYIYSPIINERDREQALPAPTPISSEQGGGQVIDHTPITAEQGSPELNPVDEARSMIEAFESVGQSEFDLSLTTVQREAVYYEPSMPGRELVEWLPSLLHKTESEQLNLIIRPRSHDPAAPFIVQLDDLSEQTMAKVQDESFLTIRTSPLNYQCWLAVDELEPDNNEELRRRLVAAIGADAGANGAVRLAGSYNVKAQYRQMDGSYLRVQLIETQPGLLTTVEILRGLKLLPPCDSHAVKSSCGSGVVVRSEPGQWPSYERALQGARVSRSGREIDVSRCDFHWAALALSWGWSEGDVRSKLEELSPKAQRRRGDYAGRTVRAALRKVLSRSKVVRLI